MPELNNNSILLHLSLIDHVGPATIEKLVQALDITSLQELYSFKVSDFVHKAQVSQAVAERLVHGLADRKLVEQELELVHKHELVLVTLYDDNYPALLKDIYLPPVVLYIKGSLSCFSHRSIALVGSRQADIYGQSVVKLLVPELIAQQWTIVSGGALGIDTLVHRATIEAKGNTVAVLGSGLLRPYPSANKNLFDAIAHAGGAVISPFSLMTSALSGNFPARNRIISGLSRASIVIQAAQTSGALITARYALEQGREVGAVPGAITNPLSAGCHKLISQGAAVITGAADIQVLLDGVSAAYQTSIIPVQEHKKESQKTPQTTQERILTSAAQAISFDELLSKTQISVLELQEILFNLQLDGQIEQNFMGLWQTTR